MKHARFAPAAVVELEDAARRVDRARPGWGDKLNDDVLEALDQADHHGGGQELSGIGVGVGALVVLAIGLGISIVTARRVNAVMPIEAG